MPLHHSTYQLKIYQNFKAIETNAFHTVIRYFEDYEDDIQKLEFEERFEILVSYVLALFETGDYAKHLLYVDEVIERSIIDNIKYFRGLDIYEHMLFKKAAAHFNLLNLHRAEHIAKALIKINPHNPQHLQFFRKCQRKKSEGLSNAFRLISLFFFFLSAILIGVELIVIRPQLPFFTDQIEIYRTVSFGTGIAIMGLHEVFMRLYTAHGLNKCLSDADF